MSDTLPSTGGSTSAAGMHLEHARTLRRHNATGAALLHFERLTAPADCDPALLNAFGRFLQEIGEHGRAVAALRRAVEMAPAEPAYRFNLSLSLLTTGLLAEGWKLYEAGRRLRADPVRRYPAPEWAGQDLAGKVLYLWEEQGIGDTLLYGSMIPDLLNRGARCILECDGRLAGLFRRSMPNLEVLAAGPFADLRVGSGQVDFHAPLGSIGRFLRPDLTAFPPARPFLRADEARVAEMRRFLAQLGARPNVALSWRSASASYAEKSIPLDRWAALLRLPNIRFVVAQYGDVSAELAEARKSFDADIVEVPGLDRFNDIEGVAALVAACDLTVTISNVTANIAGALGAPTLLLLGRSTLWYWFEGREDSPWYPDMRLLRAERPGAWDDVLTHAAAIVRAAFA